jgi:hypothetical protein
MKRTFFSLITAALAAVFMCGAQAGVIGGPNSHSGHYMPEVDESALPVPFIGSSVEQVRSAAGVANQPIPSDIGAFRTTCQLSHMAHDDPLVFPNQPGKSHLHDFFGNTGADANSTMESLATTGNSTCRGGILNRSAYWVPSMIDVRTGAPVRPKQALLYYKTGYNRVPITAFQPVPQGLRMIAGDAMNSVDVQATYSWIGSPYVWKCIGNIPDQFNKQQIPNCPANTELWMVLVFPQCWNGRDLDSPDHKSHMAYLSNGLCPATHPVAIPQISYEIQYPVPAIDTTPNWRLSSDMYDPSLPAGRSAHGDYFMAWAPDIMRTLVEQCLQKRIDAHNDFLCDGRILY